MSNDRFWLLISRHLAGEASLEEEEELQRLVNSSQEHKHRFDALSAYWGKSKRSDSTDVTIAYQKVLARISAQAELEINPQSRQRFISRVVRIAASVIIAVTMGYYVYSTISSHKVWVTMAWQVKQNEKGERSKLTLSDGSTVWLNADSELKYPKEFSEGTREIYLSGEAFFDVARDEAKPFIIHLANGHVRVLGTSFNIKAFMEDAVIETSVVTGKVVFIPDQSLKDLKDTVMLTPNYKMVYSKELNELNTQKTNGNDDKAWVDGKLIFKSKRFEDIGKELTRAFGKKIVFEDESLKNCRLTGTFQNNSLEEIMDLFSKTKDYQYVVKNDELRITGTGCLAE